MAFNKNRSTVAAPEYEDKPVVDLTGATVQAAYQLTESVICFTLNLPGVSLRNMRLVEKKAGGCFITNPQIKGKDDKWHDLFTVYFSPADEARVADTVQRVYTPMDEKRDFKTRHEVK